MFKLTCNIEIKGSKTWTLDKVVALEIEKDSDTLTDTCKITLPKKIKWQDEPEIPIKRGDKVTVALGYDGENTTAFRGYVTTIGAKTPVVISCEDEMFAMKSKKATKKAYASANLQTLLSDQNLGMEVKVFGKQNIGQYRQDKDTIAELLNNLKEQGVRSFFKQDASGKPVLYCGVLFEKQGNRLQVFDNHKNMISDENLNIQSAKDVKIKVKAISLDDKNKKTVVEVGDSDGEMRTLHKRAMSSSELKAWAEQELVRLKCDGLVGSFETFGAVLIDKLDTVGIVLYGVKRGIYQVKKNTITYGPNGFRQAIEIGDRLDADK